MEYSGQGDRYDLSGTIASLNPVMTIGEQVEEAMKIHSRFNARERKERALQMMQNVELPNPQLLYENIPISSQAVCASAS